MKIFSLLLGIGAAITCLGSLACTASAGKTAAPAAAAPTPKLPYRWGSVITVGGGFVDGFVMHPKEKGLMYCRTDVGGAYRWNDRDKIWIPITDEFGPVNWNYTGIESLAVDPTDPNKVYIAAGTYTNDWAGPGAILRSTNRGDDWKVTPLPFKNGGNEDGRFAGERLAVDPHLPSRLLFGTRNVGLWQSDDSGATWKQVSGFPIQARTNGIGTDFVTFDFTSGKRGAETKTIYVGESNADAGLYRSTDAGATWEAVPGQPKGFLVNHGKLSADGSLYLTYGNAPGPNGMTDGALWKLDTKSGVWTDITPLKPGSDDKFGYGGVSVDAQHPATVMVSTIDRWAHKDTVFRSTDGGAHWADLGPSSLRDSTIAPYLNYGHPMADIGHWMGSLEIDPFNSDRVLYGTGATIWTSVDATVADQGKPTHWVVGANGVEELVVEDMIAPPTGAPLLSVIWDLGGFRYDKLNESPHAGNYPSAHGHNTGIDFAEANPNIVARVYGAYGNATGGSFSLDNGVTWTDFASKADGRGEGSIAVSADGATFVWTPNNANTSYSTDHGATWKQSSGLPINRRVAADRVDANTFYAFDGGTGTFYVSKDGGATFTATKATGLPTGNGVARAVPGHAGDVWVASEGHGLCHSTDGGATFAAAAGLQGANRVGFGKAAPGRDYPSVYVVGNVGGVVGFYRSDDAGQTWDHINDAKHLFHSINGITGDPNVYGRVFLATAGRGIIMGDLK